MGMRAALSRIWRQVVNSLHPRRCVLCGARLTVEEAAAACMDCAALVRRDYRCRLPVGVEGADGAASPLLYAGPVAAAMKRYKFEGRTGHSRWFAAQTAVCLAERLAEWQPELLTYVPLSPGRWWKRGYNQSAEVARLVGKQLHIPVKPTLGKRLGRGTQHQRSAAERRTAAQNTYYPTARLDGKRVVLLDDVLTTGATAADAVRALREAGAARVYFLAMTRTPPRSSVDPGQD